VLALIGLCSHCVIRGSKAVDRSKYRWGTPDWYSRLRQFLRLIWVDGHQLIQLRLKI
jgi:hypothetical protein